MVALVKKKPFSQTTVTKANLAHEAGAMSSVHRTAPILTILA